MDVGFGLLLVLLIAFGVMYALVSAVGMTVWFFGRTVAGMGRWLFGCGPRRHRSTCGWTHEPAAAPPLMRTGRVCRNPRCRHDNVAVARYCARCGQPLR